MTDLVQILSYGLTVGSVIALVALGYSLVFSTTRIVNFAQGAMLVVAGFLAFALVRAGLDIWLALVGAVALSALAGVAIEVVAVRPLGRFDPATNIGWILTTFAAGLVAQDLIRLTIGAEPRTIPALVDSVFGWSGSVVEGVALSPNDVLIVAVTVALMVGIDQFQARTMTGRALRAVAQDRHTAALMGINTERMVMLTFAAAGALAAVGAVLLAPRLDIKLENGLLLGVQAFVAAVLGGLGSTRGAIVGGYALGFTGAIVRVASTQGSQLEPLVVFLLFLAVLVVRPSGLFGPPVVEKL